MSNTICWGCGGVPIGRVTTRAMEYLNEDFMLYEEEDERVLSFGLVFRGFAVERGSEVRGKESESESVVGLSLAEEEVEKEKKKKNENRSMQS